MRRKRNDYNVISQYSPDKVINHSDLTVEIESQDRSKLLLDAPILIDPHVATGAFLPVLQLSLITHTD